MAGIGSRFMDEEAERLASLVDEELVGELSQSPEMCSYLAETCGPEFRMQSLWYPEDPAYLPFRNWTMKAWEAVRQRRQDALSYWGPKLVRALSHASHAEYSRNRRKAMEDELRELGEQRAEEAREEFIRQMPRLYRQARLSDFSSDGARAIIDMALRGTSMVLWGGNGVGKTHLGWALARHWKESEPDKAVAFMALDTLLGRVSARAMAAGRSGTDVIEAEYVFATDRLILDECDKASLQSDGVVRNLAYLVNRRYEEGLQTILICNGRSEDDVSARFGDSIASRFRSKAWDAAIVEVKGRDRRTA